MAAKRDISHLPAEEQAKIVAERARKREVNRRMKAGLTVSNHCPKHLSDEEKTIWRKRKAVEKTNRYNAKNP